MNTRQTVNPAANKILTEQNTYDTLWTKRCTKNLEGNFREKYFIQAKIHIYLLNKTAVQNEVSTDHRIP